MNGEEAFQHIHRMLKEDGKKAVKNALKGLVPERWLLFLLKRAGIEEDARGETLSAEKVRAFSTLVKSFSMLVDGTQPLEKAYVTGGGVSIKEIEPKTMASKKKVGLYFCGEVLDIHGYTGGYNITAALVTGRVAGMSAARLDV